jgi:hypothetical protein
MHIIWVKLSYRIYSNCYKSSSVVNPDYTAAAVAEAAAIAAGVDETREKKGKFT